MNKKPTDAMLPWTEPGTEAFKFWISFWPVAPFFGVEYRFAAMFPALTAVPRALLPGGETEPRIAALADGTREAVEHGAEQAAELAFDTTQRLIDATGDAMEAAASASSAVVVAFEAPSRAAFVETAEDDAAPEEEAPSAVTAETREAPQGEIVSMELAETDAELGQALDTELGAGTEADAAIVALRPEGLFETAPDQIDDLKRIKGIGPSLESKLNALGIYTLDQIAGFSEPNLVWVDDNLTAFKGRCFRDDWVGQARSLLG